MEYITSRGSRLPQDAKELEHELWFNLWRRKLGPYEQLMVGDTLYWYEAPKKSIVWRSTISELDRFFYKSKRAARSKLAMIHKPIPYDEYFRKAPEQGYCLAFRVKAIMRVDRLKPDSKPFPRQGWLCVDPEVARSWLASAEPSENVTLDELVPKGTIEERIRELNRLMRDVAPTRVRSIVSHTLRQDTKLVRVLKQRCHFKCQFPGCGIRIPKKNGGYYVEGAHILPVARGGRSVIGNLLVLCPNHHKEFDYGRLEITEQTESRVRGVLNGKKFDIRFPLPEPLG